ncbi:MAG TPA: peptidyl-dipeptidase Dcp [Hanamia sp.]|nr:peptidyl-dipeptidase Dcp [Hanamia sp.]
MRQNYFSIVTISSLFVLSSQASAQAQTGTLPSSNPFSAASTFLYQAPPFNKIKDADYQPALEAGLREQQAEISKIANNPTPATFQNTLVAMEKSGELFNRARAAFNAVSGANTNPVLQKLSEEIAPKIVANENAKYLNSKLFKRIEAIYKNRNQLHLDSESLRLVEVVYQNFIRAGARLSENDKAALKKLNEEEAVLSAKFGNQLVNASKAGAFLVNTKAQLEGLSENELGAYAKNASDKGFPGKWLIPLQNTTQQPPLSSMSVRDTRQKLFEASWSRAEKGDSNDTREIVTRLSALRADKAKLLGYPTYAAWKLNDQMAKTPEAVDALFAQLVPAVTSKAKAEAAEIQSLINEQKGGFNLAPWDWDFYSLQVKKAKYDLDDNEIKPYFELNKVLEDGVFYAANQLYGITFKERKDLPVYQPDMRVFEVFDKDGKSMALFYEDFFKRDNKKGGAWMSNFVRQSTLLGTKPVIYNVCNFNKPSEGQPALLTFDNVTTMFHEFGHALHGLFAKQKYPSLSGTSVARDFVEFPSQFNEHWALDQKVLPHYAVHYQTGETIPQALVDKIKRSSTFNNGYSLTELTAASLLDMEWHKLAPGTVVKDVDEFEKESLHKTGLDLPQVPPRYRSSYFSHIFAGGYSAGYYAYTWTKMLEEDAYAWFEENGGLTRENGQRFRDMVLSRGNTMDNKKMYKDFRGRDANINAMIKHLGLTSERP